MDKYDVKKALKNLYSAPPTFTIVDVPPLKYLAVDGAGNPNTAASYSEAVEALYSVSYTLKFASKGEGRDFVVGPLEGLWRAEDPEVFVTGDKDSWEWTMLISQPEWITEEDVVAAKEKVAAKKTLAALPLMRFVTITEGTAVQIMHVGSYDDEAPTLAALHHEYMPEHELVFAGDHHEIYLSDPRRTAPEKLKTILRQPVRAK
jgi:hypothetical protein